ncbi:MAG: hypothetical protein WC175_04040 [Candidatus Dojkabacteria bacterium]
MKERCDDLINYDEFSKVEDRVMESLSDLLKDAGKTRYARVSASIYEPYDNVVYNYTLVREVKEIEDGNTD